MSATPSSSCLARWARVSWLHLPYTATFLVGPTAEDVDNKEGINTTAEGLGSLGATSAQSVKNVPLRQVITSFAGLRAHEIGGDFVIGEAEDAEGFFNAAGIESPGLSSAPAIGEMVATQVAEKLGLEKNPSFNGHRKGHPQSGNPFYRRKK